MRCRVWLQWILSVKELVVVVYSVHLVPFAMSRSVSMFVVSSSSMYLPASSRIVVQLKALS